MTVLTATAFEQMSAMVSIYNAVGQTVLQNPAAIAFYGNAAEHDHNFAACFPNPAIADELRQKLAQAPPEDHLEICEEVQVQSLIWPERRWHEMKLQPLADPSTGELLMLVEERDISERKHSETLLHRQWKFFSQFARKESLAEMLQTLVQMTESQRPGLKGAIFLLDEETEAGPKLCCAAAPKMPQSYLDWLTALSLTEHPTVEGQAVLQKGTVILENLDHSKSTDELWLPHHAFAKQHQFAATWALPILSSRQTVLGILACYFTVPSQPQERDWQLLDVAVSLAAIALEHHQTETILLESEARFRKLFEEIPKIPVQGYDRERRVIFWNRASEELYGYKAEEIMGRRLEDLIIPFGIRDYIVSLIDAWIQGGPAIPASEMFLQHKEGHLVPVFSSHVILKNIQGQPEMYCVDLDLRERKQAEATIRDSEAKYRSIFENITQGIFQISPEGRYLSVNPFLVQLLGYDSAGALMHQLTDFGKAIYVDPDRHQEIQQALKASGKIEDYESQIYQYNGQKIWISETQHAVYDAEGELLYYEGRLEDVTMRRCAEEQLRHDAMHDKLTGLYNRSYLTEQLDCAIAAQQQRTRDFALLFIDLDRFKVINDSLGHLVGDKILQVVAKRLQTSIRNQDILARFGGDEFVILLRGLSHASEALAIAKRLVSLLQNPLWLDHEVFSVGASVGIALGEAHYQRSDELLRDADIAMYRAKAAGGGHYVCFEKDMHPRALARLQLEHDLQQALQRQELQLFYQPIIDLGTGQLSGFEALLRWHHAQRGWISPADFVPIAEETGLIEPLSWWVFREAAATLQRWRQQFAQAQALTMSVNLSVVQLKQENLVAQMQELLCTYQLPSDRLKLEVTETNFLEASDYSMRIFHELKALGLGLCIDDFGTGYSSLSRLHQLPLDVLKIDRAFVDGLETDRKKEAIAHSIILLAHGLNAKVVAEGIETEPQRDKLRELGCEFGQGYWLSRPLNGQAATECIRQISDPDPACPPTLTQIRGSDKKCFLEYIDKNQFLS